MTLDAATRRAIVDSLVIPGPAALRVPRSRQGGGPGDP
mgnify:CR=1 FL=1